MEFKKKEFTFPIEYDENCIFFDHYLIMDNERYDYNELSIITYIGESNFMNGVTIKQDISLSLIFIKQDYLPFPINENTISGIVEFDYKRGLIPTNKKLGKIIEFMYNYLKELTLENRLKKHIKSLVLHGKFSFWEGLPIYYNNGDFYSNNEYLGNFKEMFLKGKIIDGERYGGYKNRTINPYTYGFERGTKFFGLVQDKVEFNNIINRDVMYILFANLYKNGKMNKF
jgi:hypothetical protein